MKILFYNLDIIKSNKNNNNLFLLIFQEKFRNWKN